MHWAVQGHSREHEMNRHEDTVDREKMVSSTVLSDGTGSGSGPEITIQEGKHSSTPRRGSSESLCCRKSQKHPTVARDQGILLGCNTEVMEQLPVRG